MLFKKFKFYIRNRLVLNLKYLNINNGIIFLFGPSGSGKTTFLKFIYIISNKKNFKKYLDNQIKIFGNIVIDYESTFCFQEFNLINELSVIDNYKFFLGNNINYKILYELLDYFELTKSILSQKIYSLSGGEKARISFILAWLKGKKMILIDETDSFLNNELKVKFYKFLEKHKTDKLFMFATHNKEVTKFINPDFVIKFNI